MRIVPKQAPMRTTSGIRGWGFVFEGKVMCWLTFQEAHIASYILGVHQGEIAPIGVFFPTVETIEPLTYTKMSLADTVGMMINPSENKDN